MTPKRLADITGREILPWPSRELLEEIVALKIELNERTDLIKLLELQRNQTRDERDKALIVLEGLETAIRLVIADKYLSGKHAEQLNTALEYEKSQREYEHYREDFDV